MVHRQCLDLIGPTASHAQKCGQDHSEFTPVIWQQLGSRLVLIQSLDAISMLIRKTVIEYFKMSIKKLKE
jgi:hypothetical protein